MDSGPRKKFIAAHSRVLSGISRGLRSVTVPLWLGVFSALLLPLGPGADVAHAQIVNQEADGLLNKAYLDFSTAKWEECIKTLDDFWGKYGTIPGYADQKPRVLYLKALCNIRLERYDAAKALIQEMLDPNLSAPTPWVEELTYWLGVCDFRLGNYPVAREALSKFVEKYPDSVRRPSAIMLGGATFVMEENFAEAAKFYRIAQDKLPNLERGQAVIFELFARLKTDDLEEAIYVVQTWAPRMEKGPQLGSFQLLTLQLADQLVGAERPRDAIAMIHRIWPKARIMEHQDTGIANLKATMAKMETDKVDDSRIIQVKEIIEKAETDRATLAAFETFDSSVRFRQASAYLQMNRFRDAALVMEGMLADLPDDPVVEQAADTLVRCWAQVERWPAVVAGADRFAERFPTSKMLPEVLFLKGQALQEDLKYAEARAVFQKLNADFSQHELAPEADFLQAFCLVLEEKYADAATEFERVNKSQGGNRTGPMALYWKGMALSMDKKSEQARAVFEQYLSAHANGDYVPDAHYRRAYCTHDLADFTLSKTQLTEFLAKYPATGDRAEALVLLGEAHMALGDLDKGILTLREVPREDRRLFEEAWFKIGKGLKASERIDELRAHMAKFEEENPESPRIAEALHIQGQTYRDEPEKAREIYLSAIRRRGNDPAQWALTELFRSLSRLYKSDREAYGKVLADLKAEAQKEKRDTLRMYALWAENEFLRGSDPAAANARLLEAAAFLQVQKDTPEIMADIADAERAAGRKEQATALYKDIRRWNPRAMQRDRAFFGLGELALEAGQPEEAQSWFERMERETPESAMTPVGRLRLAGILSAGAKFDEAEEKLNQVLAQKTAPSRIKAQSLLLLGENAMKQGKAEQSVAYYQRVYVLYGRWAEETAAAYLGSGKAFESLNKLAEASRTYQEMLEREDLKALPEAAEAAERLKKLPPLPAEKPEAGSPS